MYKPTRDQARQFIVEAWAKRRGKLPATPLEILAADIVEWHGEYHQLLAAGDALTRDWTPEDGESNPFMHLSLHLAIEEQLSINQPPGICLLFSRLEKRHGDRHAALHDVLECLGETLWRAQRDGKPLDGEAYLECLERCASH